jgi:ketosteroid isomerase-like protein
MSEAQNLRIVQDAYAAFGRGDIQSLMGAFADDISWQAVTGSKHHPLAGVLRGKSQVQDFFKRLPEIQTFEEFEPREFIAQGDRVVVLGHYRARVMKGGTFESDWAMVYRMRDGKVTQFQEFTDVVAVDAAFAGTAV